MKTKEYDDVYNVHIPLMNAAKEQGNRAEYNKHADLIYQAAVGLVRSSLANGTSLGGRRLSEDELDLVVNAAMDHILTEMCPKWEPDGAIPFSKILTSRKASWRDEARDAFSDNYRPFKFTPSDHNVIRIAGAFESEYLNEHGRMPTRAQTIEAVEGRKNALEGTDPDAQARNKKSGFNAAVSNAAGLLDAYRGQVSLDMGWDQPDGVDMEYILGGPEHDPAMEAVVDAPVEMIGALAGVDMESLLAGRALSAKAAHSAAMRIVSAHAQWAYQSHWRHTKEEEAKTAGLAV